MTTMFFTTDNTAGYTQQQCDELNAEFERRYLAGDWTIDRDWAIKSFMDEISRRIRASMGD